MIKANSKVKLNMPVIRKLTQTQKTALEQTAEALHTEVVQAQVIPRDTGNLQGESFCRHKRICLWQSKPDTQHPVCPPDVFPPGIQLL